MEIPTARVLDDGVIRFGAAQALPFRWYGAAMGIFPGLELSGRLTDITNVPSGLGDDYGAYKDKAFDFKYQIFPETRWFPALAFGMHDFFGTQVFGAEYIVLSRQIFPFDFTWGLGRKRLKGLSLPLADRIEQIDRFELGIFGGAELALHPRFSIIAEYNPITYEEDSVAGVPEGGKWPINFGLRFKIFPNVLLGASFQRGDTLGVSLHFQDKLGEQVLPQRADPPPQIPFNKKPETDLDPKEMVSKIHEEIRKAGFTDVTVYTDEKQVTAEFSNSQYLSNQKAIGRTLRILLLHSSSDTKRLTAVIKRKGISLMSVSVEPDHLQKYLLGEIRQETFEKLVEVKNAGSTEPKLGSFIHEDENSFSYTWSIKPDFQPYLNDPSGFFKFRTGIKPTVTASPWRGAQVSARYDLPFYSDIESSVITPEDSVRADSWRYLGRDYSFERLMFDQTIQLGAKTFGRLSFGYLEFMYAGVGGEILQILGNGKFALGLESDWVRKREAGTQFGLMDVERYTLLANGFYTLPEVGLNFQAQYGRFMAGDIGWKFIVSREYDTGVVIGGWYTITDTDHLTGFNRDYNDKGVFISVPVRMFLNRDSPRRYNYAIAPWSRDPGATPDHWQTLYGFAGDLTPWKFLSEIQEIKD
ncbi:MAG: hypothetical protein C4576_20220 [Desulfobacteraceae bacterium]|nr:MAG: hypothetical protein C4576_20220 [Desulfobacteraceae bacterium]